MIDIWRLHIAWRLRAKPPDAEVNPATRPAPSEANPPCTRCKKPVEDVTFKYCRALPLAGHQEL